MEKNTGVKLDAAGREALRKHHAELIDTDRARTQNRKNAGPYALRCSGCDFKGDKLGLIQAEDDAREHMDEKGSGHVLTCTTAKPPIRADSTIVFIANPDRRPKIVSY